METIFVCYQMEDDDTMFCVGTSDVREEIDEFTYAMSRKYDFDYQVYEKTFNSETGLYEKTYLYSMYNGKVRW